MALKNIYQKFNSVGEIVKDGREKYGDKPALVFKDKKFSYEEVDILSDKLAYFLKKNNIGIGKNVCLYSPNIPEFVISYFGIIKTKNRGDSCSCEYPFKF